MNRDIASKIETGSATLLIDNTTEISDSAIREAIVNTYPGLARNDIAILDEWTNRFDRDQRSGGIVGQNKFVPPVKIFEQFKAAATAVRDDDDVSNYVETTEQLAFKKVDLHSFSDDPEENNIWSQIKEHILLEQKCRQIWREIATVSQCYIGVIWGRADFKVKGLTTETGKKSKKVYKGLRVPKRIVILDPCKVVPLGDLDETLIYIASPAEAEKFESYNSGSTDDVYTQWIKGKFEPTPSERELLGDIGATNLSNNLYVLNPDTVFRITSTKPDYERFANVRMMSVFPWLDLKHNLQESDRADILGNLNAIIVVRRGDKDRKVTPAALAQTAAQMQQSARLPIMVGDDTLDIEIVTREKQYTLQAERYNAITSRIVARLYQALHTGNYSVGTATDNSAGLFKVIAASMEARRDDIMDAVKKNIIDKIYDYNDKLESEAIIKMRRVALDFDPHWAQYIFDLFSLDQLSLETAMSAVDVNIEEEVARRRKEKEHYSDVFGSPTGATGNQEVDGRVRGGNKNGGGSNQESYNTDPKSGTRESDDKNK